MFKRKKITEIKPLEHLEPIMPENYTVDWDWIKELCMNYDPYIDKDDGELCEGSDIMLARAIVELNDRIKNLEER